MIKIKAIMPSLKENNRYMLYEAEKEISEGELYEHIKKFIGELGIAKANPVVVLRKGNKGIIKVNNAMVNEVKTALMLIKNNNVQTIKVSGAINKIKDEMIKDKIINDEIIKDNIKEGL